MQGRALAVAILVLAQLITSATGASAVHNTTACDDVPAGYQCIPLLNKGTDAVIGELFYKRSGDNLILLTNLFVADDTGHTEEKLCVDDDTDPLSAGTSCLGGTSNSKIDSGCPPTAGAGEEGSGKYEHMLQGAALAESTETIDGVTLAKYTACVKDFTFFSFHFNQDQYSVEAFFTADVPPPPPPATKSGTKFEDSNGDGDRDEGEPGVGDVTIHIFGGDVHRHVVTAADGTYSFPDLDAGSYTVCESVPEGWVQSFPASGADCDGHEGASGVGYAITLEAGEDDTGNDFGNYRPASKSGTKFEDLDGDGAAREDGEPGLEGWTIFADLDGDGERGTGEPFDVTNADGFYRITGLAPGTYTFREELQAGWTCSYPENCAWTVTLSSGENDTGNDFGNFRLGRKLGTKFEDLNADGDRDGGEPGVPDVEIHIFNASGSVHDHATTAADGSYAFDVPPGSYTVCETIPEGWIQSFPASGADCSEHGGGVGYAITLGSGQSELDNDFGNFRTASKSGTKFEDLDADGAAREEGEPGLEGWTIFADLDGDGERDTGEPSDVTNADGFYRITGLTPGTYTFREELKPGWTCSYPADCAWTVTLASGENDRGNDFGNFRTASKSGTKFEDLDADGVRDEDEPGVGDVEIHLFGGDVHRHTTTAADGSYSFADLAPGAYTVCETIPDGWTQSFPVSGADCGEHGGGTGYAIVLESGDADAGNDFGNYRLATKAGTKFEDLDADGVRDEGEPGVADVEIHIFNASGTVHQHAMTAGDGSYGFDVPPGSYTVCETVPEGWAQSFPVVGADCSGHEGAGGRGYAIVLTSDGLDAGNDFGNFRLATKSGAKFEDLDADGAPREAGEPGVPGITIYADLNLDGDRDEGEPSAVTGEDGSYSIGGLVPGNYVFREDVPDGWICSYPVDCAWTVTLVSGEVETGNDFGNFIIATAAGLKWSDLDADGVRDADEPTLEGWEVHLFGTAGDGTEVHEHTTTDADGVYAFDVPPGTYTVCETTQDDFTQSFPADGADCSDHGGGFGYSIELVSGTLTTGIDFGNVPTEVLPGIIERPGPRPQVRPRVLGRTGVEDIRLFGFTLLAAAMMLAISMVRRQQRVAPLMGVAVRSPPRPSARTWRPPRRFLRRPRSSRGPPYRAGP